MEISVRTLEMPIVEPKLLRVKSIRKWEDLLIYHCEHNSPEIVCLNFDMRDFFLIPQFYFSSYIRYL